jgi:hypothetical protein
VEKDYILPCFDQAQAYALENLEDYRQVEGLSAPAGRVALFR